MIFTWKSGKIDTIPEAKKLDILISLRDKDRTATQTYYLRTLKYVYYVYSPKSMYSEQFESVRKSKFCIEIIKKKADCWKEIEVWGRTRDLIEWYLDDIFTSEERMVMAVDNDIDEYIHHLNAIPFTKSNGEENIDEKSKSIKMAKELLIYRKELRALLHGKKAKDNKKKVRTRLFEE